VALQQFQQTHGLQVTGELNQATVTMLGLQTATVLATGAAAPPPGAPQRIVRLDPSSVRAVQEQLLRYGFYHGAIDGVWGGGTEAAMNSFQSQQGLPQTAILNGPTVKALGLDPNSIAVTD
jgi:peptidoglycan hydrolase-like protein with peptidoglycan-binding domain